MAIRSKHICITLIHRRPNVLDVDPALYKYYTNVLCILIIWPISHVYCQVMHLNKGGVAEVIGAAKTVAYPLKVHVCNNSIYQIKF